MNNLEQKLLRLKKKAEDARQEKERLEGRRGSLEERLAEEFGCNTLDAARKKIIQLEKKAAKITEKIEDGLEKLEDLYG